MGIIHSSVRNQRFFSRVLTSPEPPEICRARSGFLKNWKSRKGDTGNLFCAMAMLYGPVLQPLSFKA